MDRPRKDDLVVALTMPLAEITVVKKSYGASEWRRQQP